MAEYNLLKEQHKAETIWVTGNTAIDALKTTVRDTYRHEQLEWAGNSRLILITAHRRENLGEPMYQMFRAIKRVLDEHEDVKAIYPIHINPVIREAAEEKIYRMFTELLKNRKEYEKMAHASNPYGDGHASVRIANILQGLPLEYGI